MSCRHIPNISSIGECLVLTELRVDGVEITEEEDEEVEERVQQQQKSVINTEHEHKYYARISEGHTPYRLLLFLLLL